MYLAASLMKSIIRPAGAAYKPMRSQVLVNQDIGWPIRSVRNPTMEITSIVANQEVSRIPIAFPKC